MEKKSGYAGYATRTLRRVAPCTFVFGAPLGEVDEGAIVPLADGGTAFVSFTGEPTRVVPKGEDAVLDWGPYATLTIGATGDAE